MTLSIKARNWYFDQIAALDPAHDVVRGDPAASKIHYSPSLKTDKSSTRNATPEELVHALAIALLVKKYGYGVQSLYHEKQIPHGSAGSKADEIDLVINDPDGLPFAVWEFKSAESYPSELENATRYQLFGTAPLLTAGAPRFIVCATIDPDIDADPLLKVRCIDYVEYKDYSTWVSQGGTCAEEFPVDYRDPSYTPYANGGKKPLRENCTLAEFRAVATQLHNEFFSEHPDNQLFESIVKLILAKTVSEKNTPIGEQYGFQVFYRNGKPESADEVFSRVSALYDESHARYINASDPNPLDKNTFAPERVKSVVMALQSMSLTTGSALSTDIMGAFFEEILRAGFKQDRGMYFTHDNIARFMVEAVALRELTMSKWKKASHPNQRLPYVMDPSCGSGTFLLHSMQAITETIRGNKGKLVKTHEDRAYFNTHLGDEAPNLWAKDYLYGFDHKFIMSLTAQVNMVLHGDGVTHIFKEDAYKPLSHYKPEKLRPVKANRSLNEAAYGKEMCETFDVVISNPPFGVTLAKETRAKLTEAFSLPPNYQTEALFIERAFQLLKPNGRLAVVLPESILNAAENIEARKFLYRCFYLRAIVLLPRNIFVDTPTLTSLVFAQKKPGKDIIEWDLAWSLAKAKADSHISAARAFTTSAFAKSAGSAAEVEAAVLAELGMVIDTDSWVTKTGANARVLTFRLPQCASSVKGAVAHYRDILFSAGFDALVERYILQSVAGSFDYEWANYGVSEVGFKLSKRKERPRENQLMGIRGLKTGQPIQNLHLAEEPACIVVDAENPSRALDFMAADVSWSIDP